MFKNVELKMHTYLVTARNVFLAALAAVTISGCNEDGSDDDSLYASLAAISLPVGSYFTGGNIRFDVNVEISTGSTGEATITTGGGSCRYRCRYNPSNSFAVLSGDPIAGTQVGGGSFPAFSNAVLDNWQALGEDITSLQASGLPNLPSGTTMTAGGTPTKSPGRSGNSSSGNSSSRVSDAEFASRVASYPAPSSSYGTMYATYQYLIAAWNMGRHWTNPPLPPSGTGVLPPIQYGYEISVWAANNAQADGDTKMASYFNNLAQQYRAQYEDLRPR
jgi:hypothetical protein